MANKRKTLKSVNNIQNLTTTKSEESESSPLFADKKQTQVFENQENNQDELSQENTSETTTSKDQTEIINEIKEIMAEGLYNKEETEQNDELEEDEPQIFVTNDIPLANRGKSSKNPLRFLFPKKEDSELTPEQLARRQKREAKKAAYKKTTLKHKLYVLSVLLVLGVFTGSGLGVWYFNGFLKSTVDYSQAGKPEDYIQSVDETLTRNFSGINLANKKDWVSYAQSQSKTPFDLSPVDNFVLAQYNMTNANSYSVIGSGSIVAATIITVDQFLYSEKKFDGQAYSFVSISPDTTGLVGDVAVCDVLEKGSASIKSYKGKIHEGNTSADWTYNTSFTTAEHGNLNGVKVNDIQPYLICTETVVSSSEITVDVNGNYVFTLELDTVKSVLNYIKQVKRTGGLSTYPEFKSINTKFTITPDWQLVKMEIVEVYKAVKMGMTPTITGTLNFDFTINQPITMPNLPENV